MRFIQCIKAVQDRPHIISKHVHVCRILGTNRHLIYTVEPVEIRAFAFCLGAGRDTGLPGSVQVTLSTHQALLVRLEDPLVPSRFEVQKWVSWPRQVGHLPGKRCQKLVCQILRPMSPLSPPFLCIILGSWVSAGSGFHTITEQPLGVWFTIFNETVILGYKVKFVQYEQGNNKDICRGI